MEGGGGVADRVPYSGPDQESAGTDGLLLGDQVLTTGMGEATSDYFVHKFNPYLVVVLGAAALAVTIVWT